MTVPVPDPTVLTTAQLLRELGSLRELLSLEIAALKELTDERFTASRYAVEAALASAEKAVEKAALADEKRFESVNEFRRALSDQTATFLTRKEYDAAHQTLIDRMNQMAERVTQLPTRDELGLKIDTVRAQGEQQETRVRDLENRVSGWAVTRQDTAANQEVAQRSTANRVLIVGVVVSVLVIVVNVVIALILHG